jgi:tetratricopeptide (TPR) repeat protein
MHLSVIDNSIILDDGIRVSVSPKFFDLYLFLAYKRKTDEACQGYVDSEEILSLPRWATDDILSIGKEIRRHELRMEKKMSISFVHCQQKIKGPFRFANKPKEIIFSEGIEAARNRLPVDLMLPKSSDNSGLYFRYVELMTDGHITFDRKELLEEALGKFRSADSCAATLPQRVAAGISTARILERMGDYAHAIAVLERLRKLIRRAGDQEYLSKSTVLMLQAWNHYRWAIGEGAATIDPADALDRCHLAHLNKAERCACQGLAELHNRRHYYVLGHIYNTMGKIREAKRDLREAEIFYHMSLDNWLLAEDMFLIGAAYYNLGHLRRIRTDVTVIEMRFYLKAKLPKHILSEYADAKQLVTKGIELLRLIGVENRSTKDHAELALIEARLGNVNAALSAITKAKDMAESSGRKPLQKLVSHIGRTIYLLQTAKRFAILFGTAADSQWKGGVDAKI